MPYDTTQKTTGSGACAFHLPSSPNLLEPFDRRRFAQIAERHNTDTRVKTFSSWDHLIVLIFSQFVAAQGLRGLETSWNANRQHHYHLGTGTLARSTLADANKIRLVGGFADNLCLDRRPSRPHNAAMAKRCCDSSIRPHPPRQALRLGQVEWPHSRSQKSTKQRDPALRQDPHDFQQMRLSQQARRRLIQFFCLAP